MDKEKIIGLLNEDLSGELGAIFQYMWHHFEAKGLESPAVIGMFRAAALDEMRHAETLSERINQLGGSATMEQSEIKRGGSLEEMIKHDLEGELEGIEDYRAHIKACEEEGDYTTRALLESILPDEERHADEWANLLEK